MEIRTAFSLLQEYRRRQRLRSASSLTAKEILIMKVAIRHLKATAYSPSPQMNEYIYAQTLVGALHLGSKEAAIAARWPAVKRVASDRGQFPALSPEWLMPRNHDMYTPFFKTVMGFQGITMQDKEDILSALVYGFTGGTNKVTFEATLGSAGPAFFAAGHKADEIIQSGALAPQDRTNSVVGRAVNYAKNAQINYIRRYKARRKVDMDGDREFGGTDALSPAKEVNKLIEAQEGANKILAARDRGETLFAFFNLLSSLGGPDRDALVDMAESRLKDTKLIKDTKNSDPTAGPDMIGAYFALIRGGVKPTFDLINQHLYNTSRSDPAKQQARATNPLSRADWTRVKQNAAIILNREWKPDEIDQGVSGKPVRPDPSLKGVRDMMANVLLKSRYIGG